MLSTRRALASTLGKGLNLRQRGMASVASRIGDTRVEMSPMEKGKGNYINYQRIEDNLQIVRSR
jgi:aconitate hydratase